MKFRRLVVALVLAMVALAGAHRVQASDPVTATTIFFPVVANNYFYPHMCVPLTPCE